MPKRSTVAACQASRSSARRDVAARAEDLGDRRGRGHLLAGRLDLVRRAGADRDPASLREKRRRDRAADALAGSRDHRHAAGDSEIHEARILPKRSPGRSAPVNLLAAVYFLRVKVRVPTEGVLPFITKWGVAAFVVFFFGLLSLSGAL